MSFPEDIRPVEVAQAPVDARLAMGAIDEIITEVYLPFRGAKGFATERAVLIGGPNAVHRENDAEHSWHLAFTARVLWDLRHRLNLDFPEDFSIDKAVQFAVDHDVIEVWAGDVNAMTNDPNQVELKAEREEGAYQYVRRWHPNLAGMAERWKDYDTKESVESRYVSDLDKIIATRTIFLDGGKKWHDWEGEITTRSQMFRVVRGKLLTEFGHALFNVIEEDIEKNPGVFPADKGDGNVDIQLRFF